MPLIAALLNAGRPVSVGYAATGGSEDGEEGEGVPSLDEARWLNLESPGASK